MKDSSRTQLKAKVSSRPEPRNAYLGGAPLRLEKPLQEECPVLWLRGSAIV